MSHYRQEEDRNFLIHRLNSIPTVPSIHCLNSIPTLTSIHWFNSLPTVPSIHWLSSIPTVSSIHCLNNTPTAPSIYWPESIPTVSSVHWLNNIPTVPSIHYLNSIPTVRFHSCRKQESFEGMKFQFPGKMMRELNRDYQELCRDIQRRAAGWKLFKEAFLAQKLSIFIASSYPEKINAMSTSVPN
ncbi:collagen alpha-2(IV) chain [Elysia marginata]|uniref:Collagen alpha-2(IV) chain n=1 Tax=Elysia marginata TaxID=1093978 RepID=A0AAV4EMZ7_9GAST|nr:collagen alpha-2(IV) chain [Elysia marginata]